MDECKVLVVRIAGIMCVQVWEGLGVVATGRKMLGETDPVSLPNLMPYCAFSFIATLSSQAKSNPGTIRGDFCIHIGRYGSNIRVGKAPLSHRLDICHVPFFFLLRNICHGSDSVESANKEIALWFKPEELVEWTPTEQQWIYE